MVEYYHGRVLKDDDSSFVYEGGEIFISLFFINIKKKAYDRTATDIRVQVDLRLQSSQQVYYTSCYT